MKNRLSKHRLGRAALHLACILRGGCVRWHFAGMLRELGIRAVVFTLTFATFAGASSENVAAELYREPFRPQFHFTPERNWMNDPNGMVFYDGEYHLFYQHNPFGDKWGHMSWGHAVSRDLFHWEHLPLALAEENGVMVFSGSAIVDWKNSSGFGKNGKPPLVAIYTGHYTTKPLQNQHIAYSNDRGRTWTKFSGNPVLDIGEKDFRDPKVFWHAPTKRWMMTVSWPVQRKVRFYASPNLKEWTHLSDFGPAGSTTGIWECPDLFPIAVEGGTKQSKWMLIVNVGSGAAAGGSGGQYFVGRFDGKQFTLDPSFPKPQPEFVPVGKIIADFERDDYAGWHSTGDAFGLAPARGKIGDQQTVDGFRGRGLVNSFARGDAAQGTLTSPEFEILADFLSFLIGGGNHVGATCLNLLIDGRVARTATGDNAERLSWKSWNVRELRGKKAVLEIVDLHTGGWGHINVDHILMADAPARPASEPALWLDYGPDFYAAVSWSDIPQRDGRRLALGWMSNWQYAQDVPTAPWRSAMSLPREFALRRTAEGLRLATQPVRETHQLRGEHHRLDGATIREANDWLQRNGIRGDKLEIEVEFATTGQSEFGLQVLKSASEFTAIRCEPGRQQLVLDRTHSGKTDFHSKFSDVYEAPLQSRNGSTRLRIFVDTSSVEVFANDGETALTALVFPSANSRGMEFSAAFPAAKIKRLDVWKLKSAWR
ncbi:MAG: glycoside hydrolase family 32 protein [Verrucomicrobia bacterium]|nr:glycoside hydrolase family 32 protein [Verrucomicrobiota bacterium]